MGVRRKDTEDTVGSSWVSEAPKWRVISLCQQREFFKLILMKIRDPLAKSRRHRRKEESAETRDYASAPPLTSCTEQTTEEDEKNMEDLSFVGSAVSEPRWALHMCDYKCREKDFKFFQIATVVTEGGAAHTINLC